MCTRSSAQPCPVVRFFFLVHLPSSLSSLTTLRHSFPYIPCSLCFPSSFHTTGRITSCRIMPPPFLLPSYHPFPSSRPYPLPSLTWPHSISLHSSYIAPIFFFIYAWSVARNIYRIYSTMISRNGPKRSKHDPQTATEKRLVQNNPQMIPKPHPGNWRYPISHFHSFAFEIFILRSVFASTFYAEVSQTRIFPSFTL